MARTEIGSVDFVQRLVLCRLRVESGFTCKRGSLIRVRQASKNLKMEDTVHSAARTLKRPLECIHGSRDVLLKWVGYEDMIFSRIAAIRTDTREVVDSFMYPVISARLISSRAGGRFARSRSLRQESG